MASADVLVLGGGTVGAAIAYGLARRGAAVTVLDGADDDARAARANFGLVWSQSKGVGAPWYQRWTLDSLERWPGFAAELAEITGIDLHYRRNGGLTYCLGDAEFDARRTQMERLRIQGGLPEDHARMLDRAELQSLLGRVRLGDRVTGAGLCPIDGHVDPLRLLKALHAGLLRKGGTVRAATPARTIRFEGGSFTVDTPRGRFEAPRLVIAAGNGAGALAEQVGLHVPIQPQRGQILVTERLQPMLPMAASGLRQSEEGTVLIGATKEDAGMDRGTVLAHAAPMAARAIATIPALREARLVRNWAGLRILTPDGNPVYAESPQFPGAMLATCHSGVTLAAVHALDLAEAWAPGRLPDRFAPFHHRRFNVPQAA
ncbi:NAD(P)/FAD-dependent oxidoreductase [Azospirillum endophyticum]